MRASIGISVVLLPLFAACGGSVEGSGGGATTSKTSTSSSTADGGSGGAGTGGGLPAGKCRSGADCKLPASCLPPGAGAGCGVCNTPPSPCMADGDCAAMGASAICEPAQCACNGEKVCVQGCVSSASCDPGQTCGPDHRCHTTVCAQQIDCTVNFLCPPVLNAHCERRTCTVDPECDVGYCVQGLCYEVPGDCTLPAP